MPKPIYPNNGKPWTEEEERLLLSAFDSGASFEDLLKSHGRTPGGILARLDRNGRVVQANGQYFKKADVWAKPANLPEPYVSSHPKD